MATESTRKALERVLAALLAACVLAPYVSATFSPTIISGPIRGIACTFASEITIIASGIAILVIIAAALTYVYSQGDPGKRKQAKDAIIHALIGLLIISIASELVKFWNFTGC